MPYSVRFNFDTLFDPPLERELACLQCSAHRTADDRPDRFGRNLLLQMLTELKSLLTAMFRKPWIVQREVLGFDVMQCLSMPYQDKCWGHHDLPRRSNCNLSRSQDATLKTQESSCRYLCQWLNQVKLKEKLGKKRKERGRCTRRSEVDVRRVKRNRQAISQNLLFAPPHRGLRIALRSSWSKMYLNNNPTTMSLHTNDVMLNMTSV